MKDSTSFNITSFNNSNLSSTNHEDSNYGNLESNSLRHMMSRAAVTSRHHDHGPSSAFRHPSASHSNRARSLHALALVRTSMGAIASHSGNGGMQRPRRTQLEILDAALALHDDVMMGTGFPCPQPQQHRGVQSSNKNPPSQQPKKQ